jgi:orotate phosphoribosyltransferase
MMVAEGRRLLEIIAKTSLRSEQRPVFRLASGRMSRHYVDCKQALSDPEARDLIGKIIFNIIKDQPLDAVGGLEIGAYPIATSVSDRIFRETGRGVRAFVVRKEPKKHGVDNLIAGDARPSDRTLIVDDVVTTGDSTIHAITRARNAGLHVTRVIVLIDREEDDGKRNIEAQNVQFGALFTLADLLRISEAHATADARTDPAGSLQTKSA